ncbi:multidrug resistance-associated protein 1-like isoform X4 [Mustela nigripes]|uniref:multidrug resistance-associated protein 1-like isoform X4 n=1 Tax=Mustela nigripes TaxID=77151 RepID=UPI0028157591|nr:multidrug resistance-associated protein 1-like isoform X4 [Mustela nigripes]
MFSCPRRWGAGSGYERVPAGPEAQKCNPEKNASFFSRMTYSWFSRVIILGYKKPLEREDLCELHESDSSYIVCPIFEKQWRKEVLRTQERQEVKASFSKETHARKPSLVYALWNTFKFVLIQVALFKVFADILSFTSPLIMKQMIIFCEHHPDFGWSGYGYALALFVVVFLQTLILQQYQRFNMLTSAKIKTAVIGLLYKKALLLSNVSRKKFSTGEITNLMSADAQQLMDLTANLSLLWSAPFQILMAISLLWQELGPAVLAGVAVLVFVIPVNALVATRVKKLKKSQTKNKDKQIKLLNEILHGIKILKLYAWESSYQKKIIKIREQELEVQKSAGYLAVFSMLTLTCIPFLVSLATFGIYFLLDEGNILTATKVFTSMSLFNILRLPLFDLPMVISAVVQTRVSLDRLEDFLNTEELHPQNIETNYIGDHAIGFTNASFSWDKTGVPVLKNLNIKIPEGALVAVVGPVGSGKSSVLSAILGEMEKLTGVVQRKGSVAYVAQQAWIQNCILQENILFGSIMQKQFYERVLEACALLPDLEHLPNGDQTEIGERGVNISGGQKHRVSLARAVYSGADIYLLDDPFAAVDVHVGKQLFEKVIGSSGILKNKTRILVTHNLTLLPEMDLIVVMESGRVAHMGTYHELLSKTRNLTNLLQAFSEQEKAHALKRVSVINSRTILKDQIVEQNDRPSLNQGKQFSMKKEKIPVGGVKFSIILKYLQAFGWLWVWLSVAAYLGQNLVGVAQNLWLSAWVKEAKHMNEFTEWKQIRSNKLNIYGLLGLMQGFFVCSGAYILTRGSLAASRTLHTQLLDNVLHLPLRFFEINPIGQIINRFTKDMFIIDIRFHYYLRNWVNCTLDVIGTVLVIGGALPLFILGVIPLMFLYLTIQITQSLNFWVRKACEIETNAVSIERVCEYENMDKEAPWIMSKRPPSQWPEKGIVEFINYQARYRDDLGLALRDITFQTHGEEKIGIVGRTGAGKSTLSNCLFRIVERSGGKIIIDGIDISTIGLHDLRGRLNIIPQDPVLFSGTLQMNLDPLDKYSDRELWEVLELCHLKDFVQSLPKKLLHEISEGGENLSVGQRQLVCLARALLRKTKILILDEATASIDFETDTLVQTTIRKEFSDCTILTIAHRLHSIIDSDRVLVLDSGRITEFETPQNLICQKGLFFEMLTEAGITQDSVTK